MPRQNRYLRDRMIGRNSQRDYAHGDYARSGGRGRDGRNPYGSRGGYVRDRADYGMTRGNYGQRMTGDYARGGRGRDRGDYQDYDYEDYDDYEDSEMDYAEMDEEYKEDLEKLCQKLKKKDRFHLPKEELIKKAKQMGVSFDEYDELEFMTVYYMMMSDYPTLANEPHQYLNMAKQWLEDDDVEVSPSEKLSIYLYKIIKGE
jgi:hypothetical protein